MADFNAHPLTPQRWDDLVTVFGGGEGKGDCGRCWCMWWRLPRKGVGDGMGKHNKALFKKRVEIGPPPGLVGYDGDVPVGWVQVCPRSDTPTWNEPQRLTAPLDPADASDPSIWGISCFVVRTGFRRKGYADRLLSAATDWAQDNGAHAIDACPVETETKRTSSALYHGVASAFRQHGFAEIERRKADRPLMRLELLVKS